MKYVYFFLLFNSLQTSPDKDVKSGKKSQSDDTKLKLESVPKGIEDFDLSCQKDPFSESRYAKDIFRYYLEREVFIF